MRAFRELVSGLENMIQSGRLSEADIPDDYLWLTDTLGRIDLTRREDDTVAIELAREQYGCDDIEVDEDCAFSRADDGLWVSGWLWVCNDDVLAHKERNAT